MADGKVIIETDLDSSGIEAGIGKVRSAVSTGMKVAVTAIGTGTTALATLAGMAVKTGSEFEAQMSRVKAISGATEEEFKKLKDQAVELGASTAFSATEAAMGMENLAAAGFTTEETMAAMPGLLDLAAASGEDLASSSDIAASTLRGFRLEADKAGHVADVLAENANRTNSSVRDTGEAMKFVAPLASAAGISLEETAAAIGIMANSGIQGSQAGTALRGAISRLSKPTKIMQEAMDELNISFYDSKGKMLSLKDQIKVLRTALEGMTDEQRNNYLVTLYGQESLSGMLALINEGEESLDKLTESYVNCDGAAKKAADTMMDNLKGSVEELSGSAETLGIIFYEKVAGSLKNTAESVTESVNVITQSLKTGGIEEAVQTAGNEFAQLAVRAAEQAPKLIDAGVSVVEAFVNGISQNKGRLYDAGVNIAGTLASGLAKLLPKELSKPVEDAVKSLTKSLSSGGLKEAGKVAVTMFNNLISVVGKLAKTVLPPFIKIIDKLGDNFDVVVPLVTSLVVAYKSYNKISKLVTATTKANAAATATLKAMEQANALQLVATNGGLTIRQTLMAVYNGQISIATAATGLWTAAQTALNAAMSSNPIGLILTAIAALTAGIIACAAAVDDTTDSVDVLTESERELVNSIEEDTTAIRERKEAYEETSSSIQGEMGHVEDLANELLKLADANGNVQESDEARVKFILGELNNALGTEYEIVDGVISQYSSLKDNVYDLIQAKTVNSLLDAKNEAYVEAIQNEEKAMQKAIAAQKDYEAQLKIKEEKEADYLKVKQEYEDALEKARTDGDYSEIESINLRLSAAQEASRKETELLEEKKEKYELASSNYAGFYKTITEYENAATAAQEGNYEKALNILKNKSEAFFDYGDNVNKATQKNLDILYMEAVEMGIAAEEAKYNFENGIDGYTEEMVQEAEQAYSDAMGAWENAYNEAHGIGSDMGKGLDKGLESQKSTLIQSATNLIANMWNAMRKEADSHSPSKKTMALGGDMGEGLEIGIEDSIPENIKASEKLIKSSINPMKSSIKDFTAIADKMKMAVSMENSKMGAALSAKVVHKLEIGEEGIISRLSERLSKIVLDAVASTNKEIIIHVHSELDGKEVGHSVSRYVDEDMADNTELKERWA